MRRFYQDRWFGVAFSSFAEPSFFRLAESRFYERFYEELFHLYPSWDTLPQHWRMTKSSHAAWLTRRAKELAAARAETRDKAERATPLRILSIGCGLGYVEYNLLKEMPEVELHINEPGTVSLEWIRNHVPPERVHVGAGISALPPALRFDMIYLSAADYFLRPDELKNFLTELRDRLATQGSLIMLSASFQEKETFMATALAYCKVVLYALLHFSGIRRRQFWGWLRTREEYAAAVQEAGYTDIREGRLDDQSGTFWISGR